MYECLHHDKSDLSRHRLAWPSLLSYAPTHFLFPNLTRLSLSLFDEYCPISWDWSTLFIVPTLTEVKYNAPSRGNQKHFGILDLALPKCLDLAQISLSAYHCYWPWNQISSSPFPRSLKGLKIFYGVVDMPFLNWIGRMPQLEALYLEPDFWEEMKPRFWILNSRQNRSQP